MEEGEQESRKKHPCPSPVSVKLPEPGSFVPPALTDGLNGPL